MLASAATAFTNLGGTVFEEGGRKGGKRWVYKKTPQKIAEAKTAKDSSHPVEYHIGLISKKISNLFIITTKAELRAHALKRSYEN